MARGLKKISESKSQTKAKTKKPVTRKTKPKAEIRGNVIKPFVFVTGESKYIGNEPTWTEQPTVSRVSELARAFTWYNYFFQNKDAKNMLVQWTEARRDRETARLLKAVNESEFKLTACWLARMNLIGLELADQEQDYLNQIVDQLVKSAAKPTEEVAESASKRPSIQDHLRSRALEVAGELDGQYDDWRQNGARGNPVIQPIDTMRSMNLAPNQIGVVQSVWRQELDELKSIAQDRAVAECYEGWGKLQIRDMIRYCEQVLADCDSYLAVKKVERKPRAKKAKTPEQLTRGFKYLKEDTALKLQSENPTKLIAANEAWLYNVKSRKLIHVVADLNAGSLTVKGSSIVGFSTSDTVMKTLRKPDDQIKQVFAAGKPAARKAFKEIKATETKWNGRSNADLIILKVW